MRIIMPNTVRLHRVLATRPDKVYRAFLEPDALAKWPPPGGYACTVHLLDAKVGGSYRMSLRNFTTGKSHSFSGGYVELVPKMNRYDIRTSSKIQLTRGNSRHRDAQAGVGRTISEPAGLPLRGERATDLGRD
jgi:hypothetical protein